MNSQEIYQLAANEYGFLESLGYSRMSINKATFFESEGCVLSITEARYGERPEILLAFKGLQRFTARPQELFWYFLDSFQEEWKTIEEAYSSAKIFDQKSMMEVLIERDILKRNAWIFTKPLKVTQSNFSGDIKKLNEWHQRQISQGNFPDLTEIINQLNAYKSDVD